MIDPREAAPQTQFDDPAAGVDDEAAAYDVVIVGGGPAGLSAALLLGRCRRRVLVLDAGSPRNACSKAMHGFLTRDGISPADFLSRAHQDLQIYPTVEYRRALATEARRVGSAFLVLAEGGLRAACRRLLLATGVSDIIPEIEGLRELYGICIHHCPICDGWEWRDRPVAIYGGGASGFGLAEEMTAWTRDIVILSDGPCEMDAENSVRLRALHIRIDERPILRLQGEGGKLRRIHFEDGPPLERDALFFSTGHVQRSDLAERLGCEMDEKGCVWTTDGESTSVQGLYVAGDSSKNAQLVIVAAAEGALAAVAINKSLTAEYKAAKAEEAS